MLQREGDVRMELEGNSERRSCHLMALKVGKSTKNIASRKEKAREPLLP